MPLDQKFRKAERLCRKKYIEELFRSGKSFYSFPFRLVWIPVSDTLPYKAQMTVSVQKKTFKKAVYRNLIKRRTREAYRKNKSILYSALQGSDGGVVFMLIYTASEIIAYKEIEDKIIVILNRFKQELGRDI